MQYGLEISWELAGAENAFFFFFKGLQSSTLSAYVSGSGFLLAFVAIPIIMWKWPKRFFPNPES